MLNLIARASFTASVIFIATAMAVAYAGINMTGEAMAVNTVSMGDNLFSPQSIAISAGSAIEWRHDGALPHTATADPGVSPAWDSGLLKKGQTFSQVFDTPGTFTYNCAFHPEMVGTVVVEASASAPTEAPQATQPAAASAPQQPAAAQPATGAAPAEAVALPVGGGPPLQEGWFQWTLILAGIGVLLSAVGAVTILVGARPDAQTRI